MRAVASGLVLLLAFLAHPLLRKVSVFDTRVTDSSVAHLAKLSSLRILLTGRSSVTERGAAQLQQALPHLRFTEDGP
jgi:hypothetical protein